MPEHTNGNGAPTLLLTTREAAKALAVSEKTLWNLTTPRGTIPAIRVGERSLRYSVRALDEWIAAQQTAPAETNGEATNDEVYT